jgi:hypothetical protein
MRYFAARLVVQVVVMVIWFHFFAHAAVQIAVSRFQSSCIHLTETSYAEAPMKDGEADFSKVTIHGLKLDKACGVIQVRRDTH